MLTHPAFKLIYQKLDEGQPRSNSQQSYKDMYKSQFLKKKIQEYNESPPKKHIAEPNKAEATKNGQTASSKQLRSKINSILSKKHQKTLQSSEAPHTRPQAETATRAEQVQAQTRVCEAQQKESSTEE